MVGSGAARQVLFTACALRDGASMYGRKLCFNYCSIPTSHSRDLVESYASLVKKKNEKKETVVSSVLTEQAGLVAEIAVKSRLKLQMMSIDAIMEHYSGSTEGEKASILTCFVQRSATLLRSGEHYSKMRESILSIDNAVFIDSSMDVVVRRARELSELCKPMHESLFECIGALQKGKPFLVQMRSDILRHGSEWMDRGTFDVLNECLRRHVSRWFVDGDQLQVVPLTWENSHAAELERLVVGERVHSIKSMISLKKRFVGNKRVFVLKHSALPGVPLLVLYVSLERSIPGSMHSILKNGEDVEHQMPNVAVFYSINNMEDGLRGIDLGQLLIKRAIELLKEEFPSCIREYVTLSPIPGFRKYVIDLEREDREELFTSEERKELLQAIGYGDDVESRNLGDLLLLRKGLEFLDATNFEDKVYSILKGPLLKLCGEYLARRDEALMDPVARFHLENGARVFQIHHGADMTLNGKERSYGLMVNYLYDDVS